MNHTHEGGNNFPEWYGLLPNKATSATSLVRNGAVTFHKGDNVPSGWAYFGAAEDRFIDGKGTDSHTHDHAGMSSGNVTQASRPIRSGASHSAYGVTHNTAAVQEDGEYLPV